jgi:sigma-E factor negative regulatory protein RseB
VRPLLLATWLGAFGIVVAVHAEEAAKTPAEIWLTRMANAARQLNYSGVFSYRYGNFSETSRITHLADGNGGIEKIELLEGPQREIIRNKDEVWCYIPEARLVKIDRAETRRFFPALLPDPAQAFGNNYEVSVGQADRVAGRDCQILALRPKDNLRYGYRLCADRESGLLLRASMIRGRDEVLEQFVFTEIRIGEFIARDKLKPSYSDPNWPVEKSRVIVDSRWTLKNPPAGFKKVMELERKLASRPTMVTQWLLSDGLAAVSVFIEPFQGEGTVSPKAIQQGPVSFISKQIQDHLVTVLGEVPPLTVTQIVNALAPRE